MTANHNNAAGWRRSLVVFIPLAIFLGLALLFLVQLGAGDASRIPSALIGRPAPVIILPAVAGLERDGKPVPGLDADTFKGAVTVLNVWSSWCVPCRDEAPLLLALARDTRIRIVGINYKDTADNARRFLARYGNPFVANGADGNGRVYGVPETFVIGRDGRIVHKLIGEIRPQTLEAVVKPQIEKALAPPENAQVVGK